MAGYTMPARERLGERRSRPIFNLLLILDIFISLFYAYAGDFFGYLFFTNNILTIYSG